MLFLILWIVRTKFRTRNGFLTGLFFILYAIFRIIVENFREPDASLILGILAAFAWRRYRRFFGRTL